MLANFKRIEREWKKELEKSRNIPGADNEKIRLLTIEMGSAFSQYENAEYSYNHDPNRPKLISASQTGPDRPSIDEMDIEILKAMADGLCHSQEELACLAIVSPRTIYRRLDPLHAAGYVKRPAGQNGYSITAKGKKLLKQPPK